MDHGGGFADRGREVPSRLRDPGGVGMRIDSLGMGRRRRGSGGCHLGIGSHRGRRQIVGGGDGVGLRRSLHLLYFESN